jgi:hypothetical protein
MSASTIDIQDFIISTRSAHSGSAASPLFPCHGSRGFDTAAGHLPPIAILVRLFS